MKNSMSIVLLIIVAICADACSGKDNTKSWNESEPAVITGYIRNQKIYPQCKSITVSMPFFDRIDFSYTTEIDSNGFFKMEVYPYCEREISMLPYIDRFLIAPGDSLIIEIDFSDLSKFKGEKLNKNEDYKSEKKYGRYAICFDTKGKVVCSICFLNLNYYLEIIMLKLLVFYLN